MFAWFTGFSDNGHLSGCVCCKCKPLTRSIDAYGLARFMINPREVLLEFSNDLRTDVDEAFRVAEDETDQEIASTMVRAELEFILGRAEQSCGRCYARERAAGRTPCYSAVMSKLIVRHRQLAEERFSVEYPIGKA